MKRIFVCALIMVLLMCLPIAANAMETEELVDINGDVNVCSSSDAKEIQVDEIYLDNFAVYYFYNLKNNIGTNQVGSCSFVAAGMLLSYYDTYWNDNIIEEKYEAYNKYSVIKLSDISSSPGIVSERRFIYPEDSDIESTMTKSEYWNWVESEKDTYFHFYLLQLAKDQNISSVFSPNVLFPSGIKNLLEYYLLEERGLSNYNIECEHITGFSDVRSYAIEKVKQGIPVIVSACALNSDAHSFIIYDYDEESGELFCHLGWKDDKTHVAFSTISYQYFEGAVAITSAGAHVHSNNYVDKTAGKTYCSCYFPIHPEHKCTYISSNEDTHTYSCGCMYEKDVISFDHEYVYKTTGDTHHILKCTDCGQTKGQESSHTIQSSTIVGNYGRCSICGALVYKGGNDIFPVEPFKKEWELEFTENILKC